MSIRRLSRKKDRDVREVRQQVETIIGRYRIPHQSWEPAVLSDSPTLIDEILEVFFPVTDQKEWCDHLFWFEGMGWRFASSKAILPLEEPLPEHTWDFCPVKGCHKPRPKA